MRSWRAGCGGTRTSGSEGGGGETVRRKADTALRRRPLHRRGQRYLTSVADHRTGAIVWCRPGRNSAALAEFFDELGPRRDSIRAVSIDMSGECQRAIRAGIPQAEICFDPFHVCRLASRATDQVRRDEWNAHERSHTATGRWVKGTRWSLLKAPERQTLGQLATLGEVQQGNTRLYRAFLLREELRLLYHLDDPRLAPAHLDARLAWAARSRLRPFVALARTLRTHRAGILAAIRLGLSNGRLEGLNSKIRLISHRSFGFHSSATALIALVYLCCSGTVIDLPRRTLPPNEPERRKYGLGHSWWEYHTTGAFSATNCDDTWKLWVDRLL
jgi:transposase